MAILDAIRGIEVTVCVDGQALEEYDDDEFEAESGEIGEHQASRTVAKYIESCTGKEFSIKIMVNKAYKFDSPNISFELYIDGLYVRSKRSQRKLPARMEIRGAHDILENGQTVRKPFNFSNINTCVDDAKLVSVEEDTKKLNAVGEIVVKVHRKSKSYDEQFRLYNNKFKVDTSDTSTSVHEKALKGRAISHSTGLGAPQASRRQLSYKQKYLDGKDYPIAVYRFKYRSKESLKSLLILERTPEPSPSPSPFPIPNGASGSFNLENLNADQKSHLHEFLGNLMGNASQSSGHRRIKREREEEGSGIQANKRSRNGERVVIDLTGDDSD